MVGKLNLAFAMLSLLLALLGGVRWQDFHVGAAELPRNTAGATAVQSITDAGGVSVHTERYQRIVSASTSADGVLLDLVEPQRLTAVSQVSAKSSHKFANLASIASLDDIEQILALKPDLVIVSSPGTLNNVTRLRQTGLAVFDLGPMTGVKKFLNDVRTLGTLVKEPARARAYVEKYEARLKRVAVDVSPDQRKSAMYLTSYGGKLLGAGKDTSYSDVLYYAGLDDKVARRYKGFVQFTPEQVLELDPELMVTVLGMSHTICGVPGLAQLQSCRRLAVGHPEFGFIEIPRDLLSDAGARMLDAAEAVRLQAYP